MIDISPEDDLYEVENERENIDGPLEIDTTQDGTVNTEVSSAIPQELEDGDNAAFTFSPTGEDYYHNQN